MLDLILQTRINNRMKQRFRLHTGTAERQFAIENVFTPIDPRWIATYPVGFVLILKRFSLHSFH